MIQAVILMHFRLKFTTELDHFCPKYALLYRLQSRPKWQFFHSIKRSFARSFF